jgi:heterodisulfide reductase subunit A
MTSDEFNGKYDTGVLSGGQYDEWARQYKVYLSINDRLKKTKEEVDSMEAAHRLAFIQCVGSRDKRFNKHCSGFCCMHAIKEAIIAREHDPEGEAYIFGMDIRAVGKNFEEYRNRSASEAGVKFIRSRIAEVTENAAHNPVVWYEDTKTREVHSIEVDLVILATACESGPAAKKFSELLGISLNEFGFYETKTVPPLDTSRPGVFTCGCAQGPMDIPESVAQASSAAARAAQVLTRPEAMRLVS